MRGCYLAILLALFTTASLAGEASERIFSRTALDQVGTGKLLVYSHVRRGKIGEKLNPIEDGEFRISLEQGDQGAREAAVTMGEDGKLRPVSKFPASSGNPLVPIFLESTLRTMSRVTGGSVFYIRNRIKEAFGSSATMTSVDVTLNGEVAPGTEIVFEPFLGDKNRHRMGPFADLKLTFVLSDQIPGDVVRFHAATGPDGSERSYIEEIKFLKLVEEE